MMHKQIVHFENKPSNFTFGCANGKIEPIQSTSPENETSDKAAGANIADQLATELRDKLEELNKQIENFLPQIQRMSVRYAEEFVGLIFERDAELIREKILGNINSAFANFEFDGDVKVFVHPDFCAAIQNALISSDCSNCQVLPDPLLNPSDCRVEDLTETLVARLEHHLQIARNQTINAEYE